MTRNRPRDDSGAALILVLVVITVIALGLSVMLSFADTSIRTTVNLRAQAATSYDADGSVQAAINAIRKSGYNGSTGQHCFGSTDTLSLPAFSGAGSTAVTCSADPTRVLIQCPSLSSCNRPGNAILTLGRIAGEDGLNIQQPSGSTFRTHGIVFSNSNINVVNGALNTNTRVYARGACTAAAIQSVPSPPACNYGTTANALGDDPGYAPAAASVPAYQPLPACSTPNSVVTFQPGYYDDAAGLSAMMAGNSACKHSTWWFKPGAYYFDFHNSGSNANPVLSSGENLWTVNDGYLVAGTPMAGAAPPVPAVIPGACQNPIEDAHAVGVQFIFGGDSRLAVKAGQAEICGSYSATKPPIAIHGLTSGTDSTTTLTGATSLRVSGVPSPGAFTNAAAANQAAIESTYAAGSFGSWVSGLSTNNQLGQVGLTGLAPTSAIPAGSTLLSATLRVGHRYQPSTGGRVNEALSATVTPNTGAAFTVTVPSYTGTYPAGQTNSIDVTAQLAAGFHASGYTGAAVSYKATVDQKGTEDLDGIELNLTYVLPAYRAGRGCITTGPYTGTGSASCALVSTVNNAGNLFYVQGTTYAPGAVLDVTLNNAAEQIFRFGVIARSLWIKETGSFSYSGVVIEVPDDSPGFVFSVYLTAYVCPGAATCAPGGPAALQAKVAFVDADPVTPIPGQRQVAVLSWSTPG